MTSLLRRSVFTLAGFALAGAAFAYPVAVTTNADSGDGSFRAAIETANGDSAADAVVFDIGLGTITLESTVEYTGAQLLSIFGSEATITGDGFADDLFRSTGGGKLWLGYLTFDDSGAEGVEVDVPAVATGDLRTTLYRVTIDGSAGFGLLIEDKVHASDAGLVLDLLHSTISGNGTPATSDADPDNDHDGVRVNEAGLGGITVDVTKSTVTGNAYDGVEVDEEDGGDVTFAAAHSLFAENGFGLESDLEDGLDVDEADGGSVRVALVQSVAENNYQDGFDLNEAGDGDITVNANKSRSTGNGTEGDGRGLDVEEEDAGNNTFHAQFCTFSDNQEDGVRNNESGGGNLLARLLYSSVQNNGDDGYDGDEDDAGSGTLFVQRGTIVNGNADDDFDLDDVVKKVQ